MHAAGLFPEHSSTSLRETFNPLTRVWTQRIQRSWDCYTRSDPPKLGVSDVTRTVPGLLYGVHV